MLRDIRIHTVPAKRELAKTLSDTSKKYRGKKKVMLVKPFNSFYMEPLFMGENQQGYRAICDWLDKARLSRDLNEYSTPTSDSATLEMLVDNNVVLSLDFEWYFNEKDVSKLYECCICGVKENNLEDMIIHYAMHSMETVDDYEDEDEPDNVFRLEDYM